jgi:hypothetical protein
MALEITRLRESKATLSLSLSQFEVRCQRQTMCDLLSEFRKPEYAHLCDVKVKLKNIGLKMVHCV